MKRLLILFFTFIVAFLITSCATIQTNQKRLIGTWSPEKVEKYDVPKPQSTAAGTRGKAKSNAGETYSSAGAAKESISEQKRIDKLIQAELISTLTFNADKTAIREFNGKTYHETWKLQNHGTRLLTSGRDNGKKTTFEILQISDTNAVVSKSFPSCNLKITYKKVKK